MQKNPTTIGKCIVCEKENLKVTLIDEGCPVCDKCLEYFEHCDACDEYWDPEQRAFYHLTDGRILCEVCAKGIDKAMVKYIDC